MPTLNEQQRAGEIIALRTKIRSEKGLEKELKENIKKVLDKHGVKIDKDIADNITIALSDEITKLLLAVDLPGGTNCKSQK